MLRLNLRRTIQRLGRCGMGAAVAVAATQTAVAADRPASSGRDGAHVASAITGVAHDVGQLSLDGPAGAPIDDLSAFRDALTKGQLLEQMRELELLEQLREAEGALRDPYQGDEGSPVGEFYGRARDGAAGGPRGPTGSPADAVFGRSAGGLSFARPGQPPRNPGMARPGGGGGRVPPRYGATSQGVSGEQMLILYGDDPPDMVFTLEEATGEVPMSSSTSHSDADSNGDTWSVERRLYIGVTERVIRRNGEVVAVEHEADDADEDEWTNPDDPATTGGEPAEVREARQRTRRLILSGDAFGQPKPDGSGTPSNSGGWWGLVFGLRPPGYDSSPGMGPPDEVTQPAQDGAQAAVSRRNLWALLPWFVNPNPVEEPTSTASAGAQRDVPDGQARRTADAAYDAASADLFAGYGSPDDADDPGHAAPGNGSGFVLISPTGMSGGNRAVQNRPSPMLPFGLSANVAAGMSNHGLAPGMNGGLFGPNSRISGMAAGPNVRK